MILRIVIEDVGNEKLVDGNEKVVELQILDVHLNKFTSWRSEGPAEMDDVLKMLPEMFRKLQRV